MDEGEEFQKVEPRQFAIAQTRSDERRVEHDDGRFGRNRDRLAAPDRARPPIGRRNPDAAMACMQRRIGQRGGSSHVHTPE